jgi:hypothetical protein
MALTNPQSSETTLVGRIVQQSVTSSSDTIYAQFEDKKTGVAREPQADTLVFTLSKDDENFEIILASSHSTSGGITTINVAKSGATVIGRDVLKYGNLVGQATGNKHPINREIGCADIHVYTEILKNIIDGTEATGSNLFKVGDETDSDIYYYFSNADANPPYFVYKAASNAFFYAPDGITENPFGGGAALIAGDGIDITAGTIKVVGAVQISSGDTDAKYVEDKFTAGDGIEFTKVNPGGDETMTVATKLKSGGGLSFDGDEMQVDTIYTDVLYTAGEDVSLGDIASKNDTNDEAITAILNTFSEPGAESEFSSGVTSLGTENHSACYLSDNKVAVFYEEESGVDTLYARIGDIDGKTITWGTPQTIAAATGGGTISSLRNQMIAVDSSTLAVAYRDTGNVHSQVIMGSVSGTTVTWGTAVDILDAGGGTYAIYPQVAKVADGTLAVIYRSEQAPNAGYVGAIDYTGTTLGTFGTHVLFEAGDISTYSQVIGVDTDKGVIAFIDSDDGDKGKAVLFTTAGTVVSVAAAVEYDAGSCSWVKMDFVDTDTVIISYNVGGVLTAVIGDISGLTLTFGGANTIYSVGVNDPQVRMLTTTTGVAYFEVHSSNVGTFVPIDVSGTTVTVGAAYSTNSAATVEDTFVCKAKDDKHVCFYRDTADSNKGNCEVYWNVDTSDTIIGFFTADALSAASVNVRSKGLIVNPAWSLTAGEVYWFDESGPTLLNTSGIKLGVAYDATSIDIDIDTDKSRYLAGPGEMAADKPEVTLMPMHNDFFTLSAGTQTSYGTHAKFTHTSVATMITVFPIAMAKVGSAASNGVTFGSASMSKIICEWKQSFSAAVAANGLGFGLVSSAAPLNDYDDAAASINFAIDGSDVLYAHAANGSTHIETAITGVTLTNNNVYRIEYEYGSAARFYVNGTLEATISSSLPTTGAIYWGSGCDANDTIRIGQINTSVE